MFSHNDNCSSPNTHDPSSSYQIHNNFHQKPRFEENSYTSALMITTMTMLSWVQLCWLPNSVLHLIQLSRWIQLSPKNLSTPGSLSLSSGSLHCDVISRWIEMLLHNLFWVKSTCVERWLFYLGGCTIHIIIAPGKSDSVFGLFPAMHCATVALLLQALLLFSQALLSLSNR